MQDEGEDVELDELLKTFLESIRGDVFDPHDPEIQTPRFRTIARRVLIETEGQIKSIERLFQTTEDQNKKIIDSGVSDRVRLLTADDNPQILNTIKSLSAFRELQTKLSKFLGED